MEIGFNMKIVDCGSYKGDYYDNESDYENPTYFRQSDFGIPRRSLATLEKNNLKIINNGFDPKHSFRKRH